MNRLLRWVIGPALLYGTLFIALTYPAILQFSNLALTDTGDGLQNLWNLWWVHKALTQLHTSPWHTFFLHFPYGTTLVAHTLNPFNGFLAVPLLHFFSLGTTYNLILIFSFVSAGIGGYWLAWDMTKSTLGALLAGALITFSSYHFAHAEGHLQLVALEGIPFFLWSWLRLLDHPTKRYGALAGVFLNIVMLCDYYYFLYSVTAALLLTLFYRQDRPRSMEEYQNPVLMFCAVAALVVGPLMISLLSLRWQGLSQGAHSSELYSMDLESLFIPGGHWRFASGTRAIWSTWVGGRNETSVYLGWTAIALATIGFIRKDPVSLRSRLGWVSVLVFFFIMALGPHLHVSGHSLSWLPLPYAWAETLIPVLKLSGCPVRMALMVNIAVALFAASGVKWISDHARHGSLWIAAILAGVFVELLPAPLPATSLDAPAWIHALRSAPGAGGVIDVLSTSTYALYYQTVYNKPMALGYISRIPDSVWRQDEDVIQLYRNGEWGKLLHRYALRYVLLPIDQGLKLQPPKEKILFQDSTAMILDLGA